MIKLLILEIKEKGQLEEYGEPFSAVLKKYFGNIIFLDYLLDLVSSSNCNSTIVSIVSDVIRDDSVYLLRYTRHFRPVTVVLKERKTRVHIECIQ